MGSIDKQLVLVTAGTAGCSKKRGHRMMNGVGSKIAAGAVACALQKLYASILLCRGPQLAWPGPSMQTNMGIEGGSSGSGLTATGPQTSEKILRT